MMETATITRNGKSLVVSRLLDAPQQLVFDVWTDPRHLIHWWGPDGFTLTSNEMEVKPGGVWKFIMHGPDGRDFPNKIIFIDVDPPNKLVYRHAGDEDTEPIQFHVTITFEKEGEKTRLTMTSVFETVEELDRVNREYGAIEGGRQHVNRLAEYLLTFK